MGGVLLAIVPVVMIILPMDKSKLFHCSVINYCSLEWAFMYLFSYFNLNVSHDLQLLILIRLIFKLSYIDRLFVESKPTDVN